MSTVADVISWTRESVLDDNDSQAYLWSNTELIYLLNRAYNELVKQTLPIRDQTTAAIRTIQLFGNVGVYALDSRIVTVHDARLQTNATYGSLTRTTETELDKTISNWRATTGVPSRYCPGAYSGYLSIYPKFDDSDLGVRDTLLMTVSRLPSARFTVADISAATPIIDITEDLIDHLPDGIGKRAWLKPDQYTYMPQKAAIHKVEWEDAKRDAKRRMILLNKPDRAFTIRSGSGIGY